MAPFGRTQALSRDQLRGARLFLEGSCVGCHGGASLSDESLGNFHNVALAQLGPGMGDGPARPVPSGLPVDRRWAGSRARSPEE